MNEMHLQRVVRGISGEIRRILLPTEINLLSFRDIQAHSISIKSSFLTKLVELTSVERVK